MKNIVLSALFLLIVGAITKAQAQVVVPVNGVTPTLTAVTINNGVGDQYDPHVSGNFAAYTSDISIRYYNFATGSDAAIPLGPSARDLLSDISGSKIVFSRVITGKTTVMVFDVSTPLLLPIEIDPATSVTRIGSAIGGNTVAYIDFTLEGHGEIFIHDLVTSTSVRITNDTALDANPSVSPDGTVVTWEHCATSAANCDIWQAVKAGAIWNVGPASDSASHEANPDTNGSLVAYDSLRSGNPDLFWRPVGGGAEVRLQMSGFEANPSIAGNLISFESRPTLFDTTDIFVYDISTNRLYNITNTPLVTEQLNDITVLPDSRVRVVWSSDDDGFDQRNLKAATFTLQPTFSNGKICYTNGGDIWKMDPDGSNRQLVIDAGTNDIEPEWSPDGNKIAFKSDRDIPPGRGLYSVNADGTGLTLLTNDGVNNSDSNPTWSPDGSKIAFASNRDNLISSIYIMNADGSNVTRLTNQLPYSDQNPEWSPDGTRIIFETNQGLCACIGVVNVDGTGRAVIGSGQYPRWSPDGTKIIFALLTSTGYHIYTMKPDGTDLTQITFGAPNDHYPSYSPDGRKIVFMRNTSGTVGLWTMNADGSGQFIFPGTNTIGPGHSDWQRGPALQPDADDDGVPDGMDNCPVTPNPNQENNDGDAEGDVCDPDDDNDGQTDADEVACDSNPLSAASLAPDNDGDNSPDCVDTDDDNDGQTDADEIACDSNPLSPSSRAPDNDGDNSPDCVDADDDNDGVGDVDDNCPTTANPNQANNDGDALGDVCDSDDDNDGVLDGTDNCQFAANSNQANTDGDAFGDVCDPDDDNDGVLDSSDNCPLTANPSQTNNDGDAFGDVCDPDDDNDGVLDSSDNCPLNANPSQADNDNDGLGDPCDADDDNDGVLDAIDNCQFTANPNQANNDGDALGDVCDPDDDNDGRLDGFDNCPLNANADQANNDGDALGDVCDPDDDNDGVLDTADNCPFNANPTQTDTDNDGIGDACDTAPAITTAYGTIAPSNGGWAIFGVVNNNGTLTGAITYARGTVFFFATRITSFVISGQTATIEGFSSNGRLFVARIRDGGQGQPDNFRLWIEGVEQTSNTGALTSGNVVINPWAADTRLKGWVDLHTHPMSNIAFGGKLFHGAPSVGSLMPAVQMPSDPQCRFDNRATSIAEALSQDGPTRGDPIQSQCGDFIRRGLINALESANGAAVAPVGSGGYPAFTHWPKWNDMTHQKMWIDWIRRSWEGGQRVMVALSHNNRTLAELLGGGGPISGVTYDKASSDMQIEEIKTLVAANSDFMAVARTPAELHSIVQGGRLAVVLGVEIDKIGDFNTNAPPSQLTIDTEIDRLYAQGVRYILPIHLTDNAFGDTAIYEPLFNIVNWRENNSFWTVGCAPEADEIGFRSLNFPSVLNPFIPPGMPSPPTAPNCQILKPTGPFFLGHVNARTANGLTSVGDSTIRALMRRGIIIDIDHMSNRAANRTLTIANGIAGGGYPVMSGHSGIRSRLPDTRNAENSRTTAQLARIACLGGMFGLGTDGAMAVDWTTEYARGYEVMRRAFAPNGLCPSADPLGGTSFLGLGTDANSLVLTPRPTMIDTSTPRFADIYNPNNPVNQGVLPLIRSSTGTRTWDYNFDGVAHYGMFVDFLRDVRTLPANATMNGRQIVDDQMMYGAERFYRTWLKADAQKVRVP